MINKKKVLISTAALVLSVNLFTGLAFAQESISGTVTPSILNVRSGPSTNYKVIGNLLKGKKVAILENATHWAKIKTLNGQVGWVSKDYIILKTNTISRSAELKRTAAKTTTQSQELINFAKKFLGVKYVWGGTTPKGFDCSGFVQYVYKKFGFSINRVAADQAKEGIWIGKENLATGDLVFFDTNGGHNYINHVGMYIGDGEFIHASSGGSTVIISDVMKGFYANTYMTAKRILK